jgi:hypothetical protein
MTGKDSEKNGKSNPSQANTGANAGETNTGANTGEAEAPAKPQKGVRSRLTDAQKEMLASKSRGGAASQSVGHSHKPTHASGKQGPVEKKVRW